MLKSSRGCYSNCYRRSYRRSGGGYSDKLSSIGGGGICSSSSSSGGDAFRDNNVSSRRHVFEMNPSILNLPGNLLLYATGVF